LIRGASLPPPATSRSRLPGLTTQIFIGLLLGIAVGYLWLASP
jgi:Na+/H+-dicarboxylate symporter